MATRHFAEAFRPGEFLKEELESRGWSQVDLAEILARPPRLISELIQGKRAITPETARGLAEAFGTDAQYWMNLETAYQLHKIAREDDTVRRRAKIYGLLPVKELLRRRWIEPTESVGVLEQRVLTFMDIASLDEPMRFMGAASSALAVRTPAQCAWLQRARHLARMTHAEKFDVSKLDSVIAQLRTLVPSIEETRRAPRVLADSGIRFVIVEHLPETHIDGACFWLDGRSPVIVMSLRYDRIDNFWFTLFHELGHVKNGDGKDGEPILDVDLVGERAQPREQKNAVERQADEFASETLITSSAIDDFVARVGPLYSKDKIHGFAKRIGVHAGIVVGRLQYLKEIPWTHSRETLERVRGYVTPSSLTDGWGHTVEVQS